MKIPKIIYLLITMKKHEVYGHKDKTQAGIISYFDRINKWLEYTPLFIMNDYLYGYKFNPDIPEHLNNFFYLKVHVNNLYKDFNTKGNFEIISTEEIEMKFLELQKLLGIKLPRDFISPKFDDYISDAYLYLLKKRIKKVDNYVYVSHRCLPSLHPDKYNFVFVYEGYGCFYFKEGRWFMTPWSNINFTRKENKYYVSINDYSLLYPISHEELDYIDSISEMIKIGDFV